ncbi:unnamed protein product [Eruca vesicaria subsp. sativa]|uniref:protein-serine/threonine phosphatase n=1 Tax=Eruca vesicaria subsp. sativa TaxID=29727 RepID=A0ABC8LAI9_ERUVS|nr:unnamed protein product [Eruca vesicaria subsp. sativa]
MAATSSTCKHWVVQGQICCRCKSRVDTKDLARMEEISPFPFPDPDCTHPVFSRGQCIYCGYFYDIYDYPPTCFNYLNFQLMPEFKNSTKKHKLRIGLGQKKLHLVLGLEHILIHAIKLSKISHDDSRLLLTRDDIFLLPNHNLLVKLQPFVRDFLSEAKEFFTMHVFTNYGRDRAKKVVSLLDPHMVYFGSRIITGSDTYYYGGLKSLELVLAEPRGVIVLDYGPGLWRRQDLPNLVVLSPKYEYEYFVKANRSNKKVVDGGFLAKALNFFKSNKVLLEGNREKSSDEREDMTVLLPNLKALHELFFNGGYYDVTHVLPHVYHETKE